MFTLKGTIANIIMRFFSLMPVQNKIVFSSFNGKNFSDNPRALFLALRKEYGDSVKYVWLVENCDLNITGAIVIKSFSIMSLYHLATAKLWIDNTRKREWIRKRKNQFYIQTWHGGLSLKKIEKDVEDVLDYRYVLDAKHDSEMIDIMLSGCKWSTLLFKNAFWYNGEVLECGLPRNDVLFLEENNTKIEVRKQYKIGENTKLILYCPTFRADGNVNCYDIDYSRLVVACKEKFGTEWCVILRLHPNIQAIQQGMEYNNILKDGSLVHDINKLIVSSDLIITDYSSCMFDAAEIGKNVVLYTPDIEDYNMDRGMYFSLDELPFQYARNNDELINTIKEFNECDYSKKVNLFLKRYDFYDDGNACNRVLYEIKKRGILEH